jgi:hypothetical protein
MKRFLMLVAVAAVAGAMYVAAAPGSQQAAGPTAAQFNALKKQVAGLSKKVKALKTDDTSVKAFIAGCLIKGAVVPVDQFGDLNGTFGFGYQAAPGTPGTITSYRTALDAVGQGVTPGAFLQGVDPSCVSGGGAAAHNGGLALRAERAR